MFQPYYQFISAMRDEDIITLYLLPASISTSQIFITHILKYLISIQTVYYIFITKFVFTFMLEP